MSPSTLVDDLWLADRVRREANASKHEWPYYSSRPLPVVVVDTPDHWRWVDLILMNTGCL